MNKCKGTSDKVRVITTPERPLHVTLPEEQIAQLGQQQRILSPTGLVNKDTGQPVFSILDGNNNVTELFYFNKETGEKVMTQSNFTAQTEKTTLNETAYETKANGVVERLTKYVTLIDGVPQTPQFTQFSGEAYTVADLTKVAPKPQKVQMGEEQIVVTGVTALANIPTATNSQGVNFPQHAYIHVNADKNATGKGISYTTDGTDPAESDTAKEFEVSAGQGLDLDTHAEIIGFKAIAVNSKGEPDATLTVQLSVEYNNISPDKDDF